MGMELRLNKISAPQSFLPRHLHAKSVVNMPGISADFVEVGRKKFRSLSKKLVRISVQYEKLVLKTNSAKDVFFVSTERQESWSG